MRSQAALLETELQSTQESVERAIEEVSTLRRSHEELLNQLRECRDTIQELQGALLSSMNELTAVKLVCIEYWIALSVAFTLTSGTPQSQERDALMPVSSISALSPSLHSANSQVPVAPLMLCSSVPHLCTHTGVY